MILYFVLFAASIIGYFFTPEDQKNIFWLIGTSVFGLIYIYSYIQRDDFKKKIDEDDKIVDLNDFRKQKEKEQKKSRTKGDKPKWVTLIVNSNQSEIKMALSLLESREIECYVINRHMASIFPSIEGMEMHIQVQKEDYENAVNLCKEHDIKIADDKSEMIH